MVAPLCEASNHGKGWNMSKQVDVLATIEFDSETANAARRGHCMTVDPSAFKGYEADSREARAAVAELIEANVAFSAATDAMMKSPNDKNWNSTVVLWHVANDRRSAALARCKGGAA